MIILILPDGKENSTDLFRTVIFEEFRILRKITPYRVFLLYANEIFFCVKEPKILQPRTPMLFCTFYLIEYSTCMQKNMIYGVLQINDISMYVWSTPYVIYFLVAWSTPQHKSVVHIKLTSDTIYREIVKTKSNVLCNIVNRFENVEMSKQIFMFDWFYNVVQNFLK